MIKDRVYDYYINKDFNCAETILHAANDEYNLNIPKEAFKLLGGFGGGMGCGKTCGALASSLAIISYVSINEKAHATENFKETCAQFVDKFIKRLGNDQCEELVKTYKNEENRCLAAVLVAAELLDEELKKIL